MKTFEGEYQYRDAAAAALAQQEQSKIQMLEGKMDYGNPKLVYSLYCKLLDKSVFKTYEGYAYLNHIHDFLTDNIGNLTGPVPEINEQAYIMPVLVSELEAETAAKAEELAAQKVAAKAEELAAQEAAAMAEQLAAKEAEVTSESVAESIADVGKEASAEPAFAIENEPEPQPENVLASTDTEAESNNEDDENIEETADSEEDELSADIQRIKQRNLEDLMKKYKRTVSKNTKLRELLMFQRIAILLLIIIVIVMLTIAKKSDSPTILNYREKIQNEYASWEQQLKEKEQELREREKKLSENN